MLTNTSTNNQNIDLSDLKEFFLGEKDDDDNDDIGIFDKIAQLNNKDSKNKMGGLVGYQIKLNDIFKHLTTNGTKTNNIKADMDFFVPSIELQNAFLTPNKEGELDYTLDTTTLLAINEATLLTYTTNDQLKSILKNKEQDFTKVSDIAIEKLGSLLKVTVNFTDTTKTSEVISINPYLLSQS